MIGLLANDLVCTGLAAHKLSFTRHTFTDLLTSFSFSVNFNVCVYCTEGLGTRLTSIIYQYYALIYT